MNYDEILAEPAIIKEDDDSSSSFWMLTISLGLIGVWWYFKNQKTQPHFSSSSHMSPEERRQKLAQVAAARLRGNPDDREDAPLPSPSPQKATRKVKKTVEPASTESPPPQKQKQKPVTAVETQSVPLQPVTIPENDSKIELKRETKEAKVDPPLKINSFEEVTRKLELPCSPKKPKRPPRIQIYCEGLSAVLRINITIVETPGVGSWGGEGWWKRRPISSSLEHISLPLFEHYSPGDDERFELMADSILELVGRQLTTPSIRQAASWYSKLESTSRDGVSPFLLPGNEGFQEFLGILEDLQLHMANQVAKWIQQDSQENAKQSDEEDIAEGVLFADDYDQSIAAAAKVARSLKSWNEFIDLLSETNTLLVPRFLQKLADAHDKDASGSLARRLLHHILGSLSMDAVHRSTPIHRYLIALSNILVVPYLVSPAIVSRIQEEVSSLSATEKTGRQLEETLQWSPLLNTAAYCLGPVDDSPRVPKTAFLNELEKVPDFPLCAFSHPGDHDLQHHLQASRRVIVMAQRTTEALINLTIKKEKESVFSWVKSIVKAK
jgi:hypothetical protein